jgi:hypothetical protein
MNTTIDGSYWLRFTQAPLILRSYVVFALAASALHLSGLFAPWLSSVTIPYTGWLGLTSYMFTLFFAISAILTPQRNQIYGVVALLGLGVLIGAFDTFWYTLGPGAGAPDFGNPYLTYHPYRPVITVLLPASWLLLLISPSMRKWIKNRAVKCPDCGDTLPMFCSPFKKTRRMWQVGGYLCARCGCETNMAGQKVTADTPPAPFPTRTWALLAVGLLVGVGLGASLILEVLAVAARQPRPVVAAPPVVVLPQQEPPFEVPVK